MSNEKHSGEHAVPAGERVRREFRDIDYWVWSVTSNCGRRVFQGERDASFSKTQSYGLSLSKRDSQRS